MKQRCIRTSPFKIDVKFQTHVKQNHVFKYHPLKKMLQTFVSTQYKQTHIHIFITAFTYKDKYMLKMSK